MIQNSSENDIALDNVIPAEISPYDASYPIALLSNGIKSEFERAQAMAQQIFNATVKNMPVATQIHSALKTGCRYVVDASDSTIQAIEDGILKLTQENGRTYAQLKVNGKYGSKLPIKKELFRKGIDPTQMANALQMQAIQGQLQEVADQLGLIEGSVKEVLQGQHNDRIGLYYSGLSLFLEAQHVSDTGFQRALQAQALRALAESTFQLKLTMQSDIQYIESGAYKNEKTRSKEALTERMNKINRSFAYIHRATMLRAGIYCDIGELASMVRVLEEYSCFIDNDIAKHAMALAQHDERDDGTAQGLWASRAKLKLNTADLTKMLSSPTKTLYLGIASEGTAE